MGLLRVITIAIVVQVCTVNGINLPRLYGNRLLTGPQRDLPGAHIIQCEHGHMNVVTYRTKKSNKGLNPGSALTQARFQANPFTAHSVKPGPLAHGGVGRFSFAELRPQSGPKQDLVYGLQLDGTGHSGESGYWLPQGGHIDVPAAPGGATPHTTYVFTPDFSGCSWTVTPMANGYLRLRHVEGGKENVQFNNLSKDDKGGPVTYAMQYTDYGYLRRNGQLISNVPAYAYMHYSNGRWEIHVQHQTCAPRPGNCQYDRQNLLQTMLMNYFHQTAFNFITGTTVFTVPNGH